MRRNFRYLFHCLVKVIEDPHQCGVACVERHRCQMLEDTSRRCIDILRNCVMKEVPMRHQISRLHGGRWSSATDYRSQRCVGRGGCSSGKLGQGIRLDVSHHNRTTTGAVEWNTGVSMIFSVCTSGTCTTWSGTSCTPSKLRAPRSLVLRALQKMEQCVQPREPVLRRFRQDQEQRPRTQRGTPTTGAVTHGGAESAGRGGANSITSTVSANSTWRTGAVPELTFSTTLGSVASRSSVFHEGLGLRTLLAKITSYSNFLFGLPGFELIKLPIRSPPLVELIRTQEVLPRRFLLHVCGISAGSCDAFWFLQNWRLRSPCRGK